MSPLARLHLHIDEAPEVEWRESDRRFHVVDRSGRTIVDRAKSPNALLLYLEAGKRGLAEWRVRFGEIPEAEEPPPPPPGELDRIDIFIDGPPRIFPGPDRYMHIVDSSGAMVVDRAMSARNFQIYLERGHAAFVAWQRRDRSRDLS